MKTLKKVTKAMLTACFVFGFAGATLAATTPTLGMAKTYGVLANTYTNTTVTTISGDVGFTTGPAMAPLGVHTNYGSGAPYATAGIDQGNALSALDSQLCTFTFAPGAINLSTDITHGPVGVYTPGVYCSVGAMNVGGPLTLNGSGTYIFRAVGALTSTAGATVTLAGASACDVFWTPTAATTLAANTTFAGTVIDNAGITVGANTNWTGRALAFGGTVTTDTDTLTVPTCTVAENTSNNDSTGTINVVKTVINDNGGLKTIKDFPLFINDKAVVSGETNTLSDDSTYTVFETSDPKYTLTFSGDCDDAGHISLKRAENKFCILTNDDIGEPVAVLPVPPLIDVVKVPSPLALPNGSGPVDYTYTLSNIGTVPVTDLTMVGDTCSPIKLVSGDTNNDAKLDVNEVWVYKCSTTLLETHTNTVVTTGWANGVSATDIASATVVVGVPVVPPLIHLTKVPDRLILPEGGGMVTYTEKITNPGTVALSNVQLSDNRCSAVKYISGDLNSDSKLDSNETWIYTCKTNLTKTTTNTAIARGEANDILVRDFAIATVIVPVLSELHGSAPEVPKFPNTGVEPTNNLVVWGASAALAVLVIVVLLILARKKR